MWPASDYSQTMKTEQSNINIQWLKIYLVLLVKAEMYDCKVLKFLLHCLNTLTGVSKNKLEINTIRTNNHSKTFIHFLPFMQVFIVVACVEHPNGKSFIKKNLQCPNLKHNILWFLKKNLFWVAVQADMQLTSSSVTSSSSNMGIVAI